MFTLLLLIGTKIHPQKIADESHMVSTADIDAMICLARDREVHGVITQYIDSNLPNYKNM